MITLQNHLYTPRLVFCSFFFFFLHLLIGHILPQVILMHCFLPPVQVLIQKSPSPWGFLCSYYAISRTLPIVAFPILLPKLCHSQISPLFHSFISFSVCLHTAQPHGDESSISRLGSNDFSLLPCLQCLKQCLPENRHSLNMHWHVKSWREILILWKNTASPVGWKKKSCVIIKDVLFVQYFFPQALPSPSWLILLLPLSFHSTFSTGE